MNLPIREKYAHEHPYGAPQLDVPVCLNVNENPYAPSQQLIDDIAHAVSHAAGSLNRYPDRDFYPLREKLAEYLVEESHVQVPADHIWAANGSNEVMLHILQAFAGPGRTVASFPPTYSMYSEYARDSESEYVTASRNPDFSLNLEAARELFDTHHPSVVLIASPNNPTGTAASIEELRTLAQMTKESGPKGAASILVIDEAYAEFRRNGVPSALTLLEDFDHIIVSRTMSKAFGAAGLRLGYAAANPEIIKYLTIVRLPYHLSALTQAAALAALEHRGSLTHQIAHLRASRDALARDLRERGWEVVPSDANFLLFGYSPNRHALWESLLKRGILIREVGSDGMLRVSIGTDEENAAFLHALDEVAPCAKHE